MNKDPRIKDNRNSEVRADPRPFLTFTDQSGFNLPPEIVDANPDKSYCWVAYQSAGLELRDQYDMAVNRRRFMPCLLKDYPQLARKHAVNPFGQGREENDELIKYRNHVLMERPREVEEAEKNFYDEQSRHAAAAEELHRLDPHNPRAVQINARSYGPRRL